MHQNIRQKPRRKISLTMLLSGLVALSIFLTAAVSVMISYQSEKSTLFTTTLTMNYSSAADIGSTINSLFKSMRTGLQSTSDFIIQHKNVPEQEIQNYLDSFRQSGGYFNSMLWVDEKGLVRLVAPQSVGVVGQYLTSEGAKESLALKSSYLSSPYVGATGRLIVLLSEPLFDQDGSYKGYIGGTIYLQENNALNSIFGNNKADSLGSYYYIVDSKGHLLFHPEKARLGEDVSGNIVVQKLKRGESGMEAVVNTKGVPNLAGYVTVRENRWGVVTQTPVSTVYKQLRQHTKALVLYMLAPSILLMGLAIMLARKLANPFVSLADAVSRLTEGKKVALPDFKHHWNREADVLTKTIVTAFSSIQEQTHQLSEAAMTDPLTGLANRRTLESVVMKWSLGQVAYSVMLMDIDRFKSVNDIYGHQTGDQVLQHVARIITENSGPDSVCCRFGGEEFVVLMPRAGVPEAFQAAERIRVALEQTKSPTGKPVTASVGISHHADSSESLKDIMHRADKALYKAKNEGRNRTVVAEHFEPEGDRSIRSSR